MSKRIKIDVIQQRHKPCAKNASSSICLIPKTTIAGTRHVSGIAEIVDSLPLHCSLSFKRDKKNFFDEWAVEIYDEYNRRLGYLSCEHNQIVSRLIDGGKSVSGRLIDKSQRDAWTKIDLEVLLND